jgi:hypothetical protein
MYAPQYEFESFKTLSANDKMAVLCKMLDVLIEVDIRFLRTAKGVPLLYQSGVRYLEEQIGKDMWQDIPRTLALRTGDCEDLASYRVAELRVRGEDARHMIEHRKSPKLVLYHIKIIRGPQMVLPLAPSAYKDKDGRIIEDPSKDLGMRGAA